jgi:hypothetical protein
MSNTTAEINVEAPITSNPLDVIPDEIPFDVPYGALISLEQAQAAIQAAVAEAKRLPPFRLQNIRLEQPRPFAVQQKSLRMACSLCVSTIYSRSMESSRLEAAFH